MRENSKKKLELSTEKKMETWNHYIGDKNSLVKYKI